MTHIDPDPTVGADEIGRLFRRNAAAVGAVLNDLGEPADDRTGRADRDAVWNAIVRAAAAVRRKRERREADDLAKEAAIWEHLVSKPSEETMRLAFIQRMVEDHGYRLVERRGRRQSLMVFAHPERTEPVRILTVVAMKTRGTDGRCSFSVNRFDQREFDWLAMLSKPWGKVFVRSYEDLERRARGRRDGEPQTSMNITMSKETAQADLLENRVREIAMKPI